MGKELILSIEELFFLGKLIKGKHLNYKYIAAMDDIQINSAAYMQRCRNRLCDKGILQENLWGDITVDEKIVKYISPVFEGEFEASVEVVYIGENIMTQQVLFHGTNENCLISIWDKGQIRLREIDSKQVDEVIFSLMPKEYNQRERPDIDKFENVKIDRMIVVKNVIIGKSASAGVFYDCGGWLCEQVGETCYHVLSPKQFYDKVSQLLKGAYKNGLL